MVLPLPPPNMATINEKTTSQVSDDNATPATKADHIKNEVDEDVSDFSKPPGFEKFVKEENECAKSTNTFRTGKCSTSFGNYKRKELRGFSFIDEMNRMVEVGGALGYDVRGCRKSLTRLINGIEGERKNLAEDFYIINVYGPQHQPEKSILWSFLRNFILNHTGKVILFGDLNKVRSESERFGSIFSNGDAAIFNDFIRDSGLIDLPMGGRKFTWMNKVGTKMSKLDRFLISDDVVQELPYLQVVALDKLWSDHNPILLHSKKHDFGPTPFKIFHSWFERLDFKDIFAHTKEVELSRRKSIVAELRSLEQKIDDGQATEDDKRIRTNRLKDLDDLEKIESIDLAQKARVKWEVEGDENSKFFHGLIKSRRKSQTIHGIMHGGIWLTDPSVIKETFVNFYKDKFSCQDSQVSFPPFIPTHHLHTSDRDSLEAIVSMDEIKMAVWECGSNKAPGPDGYSFMFIKRIWKLLKHDIQEFVDSFFATDKFPQRANSAFIVLILKVPNPLFIKDYRPISLIGLHYKIVAKILANRLSKVMDSIISPEQSAFISGCQILDGPLILSEIVDWYEKRKKKLMLFKVDFEKAFDSVSWRYLDYILDKLGFGIKWRSWIKSCLLSARTSILINGSPTLEFSLKRGLRQGDPLSPFLFIIVMEGLHMALNDGIAANLFHGVKFNSSNIHLSHLFYADDVIILSE
ncbi:putative RNA-directed DNA polymerase, eukaryota, reverse transcriptase zinc-binding domain protein [Tanacetum coccineum]